MRLADYMKTITYAFKITCLQTMLPSVMKAEYDKLIYPVTDEPEVVAFFAGRQRDFLEGSGRNWDLTAIDPLA